MKYLYPIVIVALLILGLGREPVHAASNLTGCVPGQMLTQSASGGPLICYKGANLTLAARLVPIGSTGDQGLFAIPAGITKYQLLGLQITNCTVTPVLAQPSLWTSASGGGTNLVAAATITGATTSGIILNSTLLSIAQTNALNAANLYVNIAVANVSPATCDFYATIRDLT